MATIDRAKPVWRAVGRIADGRRCTCWVNAETPGDAELEVAREGLVSVEKVERLSNERMDELDRMAGIA